MRDYVDAGFSYLEGRQKGKRQVTIKKRLKLAEPENALDQHALELVENCHSDRYAQPFAKPLAPVIGMRYERITLVAKGVASG